MSAHASPWGFDPSALERWIIRHLSASGPMRLTPIGGGQSNPTFFVDFDNLALVLRKQPVGEILPSAHAVDREFRIMQALAQSDVPVPEVLCFSDDRSVVGTPFYLMRKLQGRVFPGYDALGVSPDDRHQMYLSMARTMAQLHNVDWAALGLSDYGKPGGFFSRQVARWSRQWQQSRSRDNPHLDRLIQWLPQHIPLDEQSTICHGDFRMGNLMFHPTEPRVIAVLDWELSTLGHPLADVSFNTLAWITHPQEYGGILGLDHASLGIPTLADYLAHYVAHRAIQGTQVAVPAVFHYVFSLFRFAVIFEGIAARALAGNAVGENAAQVGLLGLALAQRAVDLIDHPEHLESMLLR